MRLIVKLRNRTTSGMQPKIFRWNRDVSVRLVLRRQFDQEKQ